MPWKVFHENGKYCVHKLSESGDKMGVVHCHDSEEQASAQARALYAGEADGSKATWDTAYVNNLPDSAFLYVESGDKDSEGKTVPRTKRHFPYKDASGAIDLPHLRNAIARIPQSNAPGLNAEAVQKRAQALLERANSGSKAGLLIHKQADGAYRWVGWVSNHYRDNDNPREIISGAAHKEFVEHADATGEFPELWLWHVPGSKIGQADWLEFADGFLLSSGTFDSPGVAEALAKSKEPLTMSHGFVRLKHDGKSVTTDGYRMLEASVTPQGAEANPWTRFGTIKEADMPISKAKKAFLAKYLPAETLSAIEDNTAELRKAAETAGVDWKEVEAAETVETAAPVEAAAEPTPPTPDSNALAEAVLAAIVERLSIKELSATIGTLTEQMGAVKALADKVTALEAVVKALKETDDAKIAAAVTPKAAEALVLSWANKAASKSPETIVNPTDEKDKKLVDQRPFLAQLAESLTAQIARGGA